MRSVHTACVQVKFRGYVHDNSWTQFWRAAMWSMSKPELWISSRFIELRRWKIEAGSGLTAGLISPVYIYGWLYGVILNMFWLNNSLNRILGLL